MLFNYKAIDDKGIKIEGKIDAPNQDLAINGLQRRGLVVLSVEDEKKDKSVLQFNILDRISPKDIVILSRQISTLFESQISALKVFTMLAANTENKTLNYKLLKITDDVKAGLSISNAFAKHPDVFSTFYVNMVRAGEEAGKLNQIFAYLAEYLDRQYAINSKVKNALIYPAFVVFTLFVVLILMFNVVIPKLAAIILDFNQEVPFYTKIVIGVSNFFVSYGFLLLILLVVLGVFLWHLSTTERGQTYLDQIRFSLPLFGNLSKMFYLARISDNINTMFASGITILRSIDITSDVVGSRVYQKVLKVVLDDVRSGVVLSAAFAKHTEEIPSIMVQMVRVGEETGSLGKILKTLSDFYTREVDDTINTMVSLIEPIMIVVLGLLIGLILVSILVPIYNLAGGIV
jgi:type IV pilus assembly protein PilC